MRQLSITLLLLAVSAVPVAGERRHHYFPWHNPYTYTPQAYPTFNGPRIVEVGHRYYGAGRRIFDYRPYSHRRYGHGPYDPYRHQRPYRTPYRRYDPYYGPSKPYYRYQRYTPGVYRFYVSSPTGGAMVRANSADLVIDVQPAQALIFIDSKLVGSGRDFASDRAGYPLMEGEYELRVEHPGYEPFVTQLKIVPDRTVHLKLELTAGSR